MINIKERVRLRITEGGKVISKIKSGDDLWKKQNRWLNLNRTIDRKNDRYREGIKDLYTGATVHHCDEQLSDHQSHGSARKRA